MVKNDKLLIVNYMVISFIVVFFVNIVFNSIQMAPIMSLMSGDIWANINYWLWDFVRIFLILFGETWFITMWFYYVSKRLF